MSTAGRSQPRSSLPTKVSPPPWRALSARFADERDCLASFIALDLLISEKTRANTWPGLALVLAGVPVYLFTTRRSRGAPA